MQYLWHLQVCLYKEPYYINLLLAGNLDNNIVFFYEFQEFLGVVNVMEVLALSIKINANLPLVINILFHTEGEIYITPRAALQA